MRLDLKTGQSLIQPAGILPHLHGAILTATGGSIQQVNGWETVCHFFNCFCLRDFRCHLGCRLFRILGGHLRSLSGVKGFNNRLNGRLGCRFFLLKGQHFCLYRFHINGIGRCGSNRLGSRKNQLHIRIVCYGFTRSSNGSLHIGVDLAHKIRCFLTDLTLCGIGSSLFHFVIHRNIDLCPLSLNPALVLYIFDPLVR